MASKYNIYLYEAISQSWSPVGDLFLRMHKRHYYIFTRYSLFILKLFWILIIFHWQYVFKSYRFFQKFYSVLFSLYLLPLLYSRSYVFNVKVFCNWPLHSVFSHTNSVCIKVSFIALICLQNSVNAYLALNNSALASFS